MATVSRSYFSWAGPQEKLANEQDTIDHDVDVKTAMIVVKSDGLLVVSARCICGDEDHYFTASLYAKSYGTNPKSDWHPNPDREGDFAWAD